jgi:hypothetical protein
VPEDLSPPGAMSSKLSAPPLFSEELFIKQLDTSSNTDAELAALDLAFPVFRQLDDELFFDGGWTPVLTGFGGKTVFVGRGRDRRYAGDKTLERGRYWSICSVREGFDHATLLNEVRAYHAYMSRSMATSMIRLVIASAWPPCMPSRSLMSALSSRSPSSNSAVTSTPSCC